MSGKKYANARASVDREKLYAPLEAVRTLKALDTAKFDETVEVHMRLGVNVRHADQQLRGTLMLPHGTGRELRVAVFAEGEKAKEAEDAGADVVGAADLATRIEGGFDGLVQVEVKGLPPEVTASHLTIAPSMTQGVIVLTASPNATHAATTALVCVRSSSLNGRRRASARILANSGDSSSDRRSRKLTPPPRPPTTNAMRHA